MKLVCVGHPHHRSSISNRPTSTSTFTAYVQLGYTASNFGLHCTKKTISFAYRISRKSKNTHNTRDMEECSIRQCFYLENFYNFKSSADSIIFINSFLIRIPCKSLFKSLSPIPNYNGASKLRQCFSGMINSTFYVYHWASILVST